MNSTLPINENARQVDSVIELAHSTRLYGNVIGVNVAVHKPFKLYSALAEWFTDGALRDKEFRCPVSGGPDCRRVTHDSQAAQSMGKRSNLAHDCRVQRCVGCFRASRICFDCHEVDSVSKKTDCHRRLVDTIVRCGSAARRGVADQRIRGIT